MTDSLRRLRVLIRRNALEIIRDPLSLIFLIGMPLVMEVLFYAIFHKLTAQFEMKYLAPGIVVFAQSFTTLFAGLLIAVDRGSAFLTRLYVSPARPFEITLGYALALIPLAFVQSVLFFAVGAVVDPSILSFSIVPAVLACVLTSLFFIGAGILLGSVCTEKSIGGAASALIAGQSVLSGMWFPLDGMGEGVVTAMKVLPFRNATLLVQNALNGTDDPRADIAVPLLIVLAYTAAVFVLAAVFSRPGRDG